MQYYICCWLCWSFVPFNSILLSDLIFNGIKSYNIKMHNYYFRSSKTRNRFIYNSHSHHFQIDYWIFVFPQSIFRTKSVNHQIHTTYLYDIFTEKHGQEKINSHKNTDLFIYTHPIFWFNWICFGAKYFSIG